MTTKNFITEMDDGKAGPVVQAEDFAGAQRVAKLLWGEAVQVVGSVSEETDSDVLDALQKACESFDDLFGDPSYVQICGSQGS